VKNPVANPNPADIEKLKLVCRALNGGREWGQSSKRIIVSNVTIQGVQKELRRLVTAWTDAGHDGNRLLESNNTIAKRLRWMKGRLVTTSEGIFEIEWPSLEAPRRPHLPTQSERWEDFAFIHFANLLLNPVRELLGGPCVRCNCYFVKRKSAHQYNYCSRRCRQIAAALAATRRRLDEERADRLRQAREAIEKYTRAPTKLDWKSWIAKAEPAITKTFLTRAENQGDLRAPGKGDHDERI
jgi:endogenous inhibitor of DNA gyrase (YacG/DUF329 family)